jgi:hypothetical protein
MASRLLLTVSVLSFMLLANPAVHAQKAPPEPLVDQVKKSIDRGVDFLKKQQNSDGSWEAGNLPTLGMKGGQTSLAVLALLNSGLKPNDPVVAKGLEWLRNLESNKVYVKALQTMALSEAAQIMDPVRDKQRIIKNVNWLLKPAGRGGSRQYKDNAFIGWYYDDNPSNQEDGSNRQYAVLGLISGRQGGAVIDRDVWVKIRKLCEDTQLADGSWKYSRGLIGPANPEITMTEAGICNLLIAAMELNVGCDSVVMDQNARKCGIYPEDDAIKRGLSWMSSPKRDRLVLSAKELQQDMKGRIFYHLYGVERIGRFSGDRFIGVHDWYREGSEALVELQNKRDGSWHIGGQFDQWPIVSTSFALLFLSKGRTPVLMSKIVHTQAGWPRNPNDTDWNNDRNDLRNLTDFARRNLFKNQPLAWQSFDLLRIPENTPVEDVAGELLASPIAYITGHMAPRFTGREEDILKKFVENGGFILAEACCGDPRFDKGFKALVAKLWPNSQLEYLDADHPVWTAHFNKMTEPWKRVSPLMGLKEGCKTVLIYSPKDLSCRWESNKLSEPLIEEAFQLGCNIITYATGLELPQPRLAKVDIPGAPKAAAVKRGRFRVGQVRHKGDYKVAPRAMTNLMERLRTTAGVDVVLQTEDIELGGRNDINFKFLYMHGRGAIGEIDDRDLEHLRFNLENGGLLLADACCGSPKFDKSFREFVQALFPPAKYPKEKYPDIKLQRIPEKDFLFSDKLNFNKRGEPEALTEKNIVCRTEKGGKAANMKPFLEGVKIDGRWVIIYSKYDIGCALENNRSSDCVGYDTESAYKIAGAAALYMLRPRPE